MINGYLMMIKNISQLAKHDSFIYVVYLYVSVVLCKYIEWKDNDCSWLQTKIIYYKMSPLVDLDVAVSSLSNDSSLLIGAVFWDRLANYGIKKHIIVDS